MDFIRKPIINKETIIDKDLLDGFQDGIIEGIAKAESTFDKLADKADKVTNAIKGDFAGLDANGNIIDSGYKAGDFATSEQGARADSALQEDDITSGSANGTIAIAGVDIPVTGLGSAAFTDAKSYAVKSTTEAHIANNNLHVTANDKTAWNNAVKNVNDLVEAKPSTDAHIANSVIHVKGSDKTAWNNAVENVEVLMEAQSSVDEHIANNAIHVKLTDKTAWNNAINTLMTAKPSTDAHIKNSGIHVTAADKASWNASVKSVNNIVPDKNGNVEVIIPEIEIPEGIPTITSAQEGQTIVIKSVDAAGVPTEWEATEFPATGVRSINGSFPDENGNVEVKIPDGVASVTSAFVGQILVVKTVDATGKPIEWEAVDMPTGGGTGGGSNNNAVFTLTNTAGWISKTFSVGSPAPVSFKWSSIEQDMETGPGVLKITVNDVAKKTVQIDQGEHTIDMSEYLSLGDNIVQINVRDMYGNSQTINFNQNVISLVLESNFDSSVAYTGDIPFVYTPVAAVEKTVYFKIDGEEIGTDTVTVSGRQQPYTIPAQAHGSHSLEVYFTATIDGSTVDSNHLYYDLICLEEGNTTPVISTSFRGTKVEQYESVVIPYIVYNPQSLMSEIVLASSENVDPKPLTVDRTEQIWTYRPEDVGELMLTITCGEAVRLISLNVTESSMKVSAETNDLSLYLTAYGRSNNEENPSVWKNGDIEAELTGFTFVSDGWVKDEDQNTVLRVSGDARVEIPVNIFAQDFRTTGKTIEIEFASRNVLDYDAVLATCWAGDRGFTITAQQAMLKSEQSTVNTPYKEDDHLRLSFVIEKRTKNRLILSYVNGIISGMVQYPDDDDFSQADAVGISLGSNDCIIDIYNIRIYDNDLTRFQVLDNWIADTQNIGDRKDRYDRNDIFDQYGVILPTTLRPHQCYLVLDCPILPSYKGDKKTCAGRYVDPVHPDRSFTFTNAEIDVQGTSSQYYYVKNFKIKFKNGFKMADGSVASTYAMNDKSVPVSTFTFKADVASSEGANNVVLAELYNDLCSVQTPPQKNDPRVRQCIEGHPIVVFHDDGNGPKFIGKYNFNNDKGTAAVFGFADGDESWEILENGNALVSFKNADFSNWTTSFEARYPDKYKNIDRLKSFVEWVASTDTDAVSSEAEKTARLEKFKNELSQWADVEDAIFYYLFTLIFLCIDQREKNAFPTWYANKGKWMWLFYDADSTIGTDNKGNLTFEYWMEDIDYTAAGDPVFNGQNNVFWSNIRRCFADEIRDEYRRLRTELGADRKVLLSYDKVNDLFTAHQSQWSEAIYNEDAWRKAVEPLEKNKDDQYLPMQQGKKEHHFKQWMYNRFRYLDSKFETGAALDEENRIMMRAHAQGNIFLTSYINMYGQVYFNSERAENRMIRDREYEFEWSALGAEDAVIGVNSAPMITSMGDLSPLMLEYCHIQYAKHLTSLKLGDASPDYVNDNLNNITLGNNILLRTLDVRNCVSLTQSVDASGCANIEEVYFDGTSITGLSLPNGGILKKLHLPGTITNLTLRNQPQLSEFVLPSYSQITTLRLENVSGVDSWAILHAIPANSRVRLIGFDWTQNSVDDIRTLYDKLDTMRGLDENGNNVDKAQISGTIRIDSLTGDELEELRSRYPDIKIVYQHLVLFVYYKNWNGELLHTGTVLQGGNVTDPVADGTIEAPTRTASEDTQYQYIGWNELPTNVQASCDVIAQYSEIYRVRYFNEGVLWTTQWVADGENAPAVANPSKESTAQYAYTFTGWDATLTNITAPVDANAVFTATVRTYTVYWYNGSTLLETDTNVPYGTIPTYDGADPVYNGEDDPSEYSWVGWTTEIVPVTSDATYTAKFKSTAFVYAKLISRNIKEYSNDSITTVGNNAFYDCKKLVSVDCPAVTSVGANAFRQCDALTSVNLPSVESTGANAFYYCKSLGTANLPALITIGNDSFYGCEALAAMNLPVATSIPNNAFRSCTSLATVDIGVANKISTYAFGYCNVLTAIVLRMADTICTLANTNAFYSTPISSGTGYIYVPRALLSDDDETKDYRRATNWSTYASQFRALEDYTVDGTNTGELDQTKI